MNKRFISTLTALGRVCYKLSEWLEEAGRRLVRCPDCGRSLYYGKPCK